MSQDREKTLKEVTRVEVMIGDQISRQSARQQNLGKRVEAEIEKTERFLIERGLKLPSLPEVDAKQNTGALVISAAPWDELLEKAKQSTPDDASISDLLTEEEIQSVLAKHQSIGEELGWLRSLDRYDLALAISAGLVAGLMDVLLVKTPAHPGFMGSKGSEGGWLSNNVKEFLGSTPFPRTVLKRLTTSDPERQLYVASWDCGTAQCSRIHQLALRSECGNAGGGCAPA